MVYPLISIIVCTYNREKFIKSCLEHLKNQALSIDFFEVLIIDNNSNDNSASIINSFINANPLLPFYYFLEVNKGLSHARNRGIAESKAKWITYIDDDAEAAPSFAENIKKATEDYKDAIGFGGCVKPKYSESAEPAWMNKYLYGYVGSIDLGLPERKFEGKMKYPIGCNMTYRKDILLQAGGFNNDLQARSDDKYIFFEVSKLSNNIYYIPGMFVLHNIDKERLLFTSFKKLYLKTGNEEKKRLSVSFIQKTKKFFEYLFKIAASLLLWIVFIFKGQEIKGRFLFFSCWFTFVGFLKNNVKVR